MDIEVILIIIMAALLLFWVIFCVCFMLRRILKDAARADMKAQVQCESCGSTFEVPWKEAVHISMTKTRSTTKTKVQDGALVSKPVYSSYAKKFYCADCEKKTFGQVLNLEEMQESIRSFIRKEACRGLVRMVAGGLAILIVMQIPMHFADHAKEKEIEQMKEQQFEDIKERYWGQ